MSIDIYGLAQGKLVELLSERDALRVQLAAAEHNLDVMIQERNDARDKLAAMAAIYKIAVSLR